LSPILGVHPLMGRLFSRDEDKPGHDRVALLDFGFWKSQMAGDADIVGREVRLNGEPFTAIGVMPEGFAFGGDTNIWVPLALDRAKPGNRGNHYLEVVARLRPGASLKQASTDLENAARRMTTDFPLQYQAGSGFTLYPRPLQADLVGSARITRQLMTESVVLSAIGGGFGMLLAWWGTDALRNSAAVALPQTRRIAIDARVLLFSATVSLLTGILFGIIPALRVAEAKAYGPLNDSARGSTTGSGHRLRNTLVVAEIALAVVLLVGAGLTARSLQRVLEVNPGFGMEGLLTSRISLPASQYRDRAATASFFSSVEQRVSELLSIESAGGDDRVFSVDADQAPARSMVHGRRHGRRGAGRCRRRGVCEANLAR
jgi:hypothetical protein